MVIELSPDRRRFLAGLLATGLAPTPSWADAGSPAFLSAAAHPDGTHVLCGIDAELRIQFQCPLPARGHAAAAHPARPEAVAFARRPGTYAIVIDCQTGQHCALLSAPQGRHFYGHGIFSLDGRLLFTTENDFETGQGRIGVWDTSRGYSRVDDWSSGGIGPHDIKRIAGSETLVVANGGIDTHPDTGRTKLNIATMKPNLAYIAQGTLIDIAELPMQLHKNSIRHLSLGPDGQVAFGMQWQGQYKQVPLVGLHKQGSPIQLLHAPQKQLRDMHGYVGSIAFSLDGQSVAVTSPKGGKVQFYDVTSGLLIESQFMEDVCGLASTPQGFMLTSGTGTLATLINQKTHLARQETVRWDNHLIRIQGPEKQTLTD